MDELTPQMSAWLQRANRLYRRLRQPTGKPRGYIRPIDLLATYLPRLLSHWMPDIVWRLPPASNLARDWPQPDAPRTICLTFDDGPTSEGTAEILDVLEQHRVPATFFLLGEQARQFPGVVRQLVTRGHQIGNHTFSHCDGWIVSPEEMRAELEQTDRWLAEITGQIVRHVRPPHGHVSTAMREWCAERGQALVMWDVLPCDFTPWATPESIAEFIWRHVRPGSIVVLHDSAAARRVAAPALRLLIPRLLNCGWEFVSLPEPMSRKKAAA